MNGIICEAIGNRKVIRFRYEGYERIVEPHCYGIHKTTENEVLRAHQIGGYSSSGNTPPWRLYLVSEMSGIALTNKEFQNPRAGYARDDSDMSRIFCQL